MGELGSLGGPWGQLQQWEKDMLTPEEGLPSCCIALERQWVPSHLPGLGLPQAPHTAWHRVVSRPALGLSWWEPWRLFLLDEISS